jgi:transcriptional regulator with XRE-family HTH domain
VSDTVRVYNSAGLGAAVRHFREEAALTQQELADRVGVHRTYLARLESGSSTEQLERLVALLKELGARIIVEKADW